MVEAMLLLLMMKAHHMEFDDANIVAVDIAVDMADVEVDDIVVQLDIFSLV